MTSAQRKWLVASLIIVGAVLVFTGARPLFPTPADIIDADFSALSGSNQQGHNVYELTAQDIVDSYFGAQ